MYSSAKHHQNLLPSLELTPRNTHRHALPELCKALQVWATATATPKPTTKRAPANSVSTQQPALQQQVLRLSSNPRQQSQFHTGQEGSTAPHLSSAASLLHFVPQHRSLVQEHSCDSHQEQATRLYFCFKPDLDLPLRAHGSVNRL